MKSKHYIVGVLFISSIGNAHAVDPTSGGLHPVYRQAHFIDHHMGMSLIDSLVQLSVEETGAFTPTLSEFQQDGKQYRKYDVTSGPRPSPMSVLYPGAQPGYNMAQIETFRVIDAVAVLNAKDPVINEMYDGKEKVSRGRSEVLHRILSSHAPTLKHIITAIDAQLNGKNVKEELKKSLTAELTKDASRKCGTNNCAAQASPEQIEQAVNALTDQMLSLKITDSQKAKELISSLRMQLETHVGRHDAYQNRVSMSPSARNGNATLRSTAESNRTVLERYPSVSPRVAQSEQRYMQRYGSQGYISGLQQYGLEVQPVTASVVPPTALPVAPTAIAKPVAERVRRPVTSAPAAVAPVSTLASTLPMQCNLLRGMFLGGTSAWFQTMCPMTQGFPGAAVLMPLPQFNAGPMVLPQTQFPVTGPVH